MTRLPNPGSDDGTWGNLLNDFLSQSHKTDGSLKDNSVGSAQLQDNSVTAASLSDDAVDSSILSATGGSDGQVLVKDSAVAGGMAWKTRDGLNVTSLNAGVWTRPSVSGPVMFVDPTNAGSVDPTSTMQTGDLYIDPAG